MDYHKNYEYLSKSFLVQFEKSPLHAYHYMNSERVATPAMIFGQAYHAVLEGTFERDYCTDDAIVQRIGGSKPRATKEYKEWAESLTKKLISHDDYLQILSMRKQLEKTEIVKRINAFNLVQEQPFYAEIDGYKVKCKPDGLQLNRGKNGEHLIIDWKTTDDLKYIERTIIKYGYDVQAALYCEIISKLNEGKETNMLFIFQEKNAPYDVLPVLIKWGGDAMFNGKRKWREYAKQAKQCFETNNWPSAGDLLIDKCIIL